MCGPATGYSLENPITQSLRRVLIDLPHLHMSHIYINSRHTPQVSSGRRTRTEYPSYTWLHVHVYSQCCYSRPSPPTHNYQVLLREIYSLPSPLLPLSQFCLSQQACLLMCSVFPAASRATGPEIAPSADRPASSIVSVAPELQTHPPSVFPPTDGPRSLPGRCPLHSEHSLPQRVVPPVCQPATLSQAATNPPS